MGDAAEDQTPITEFGPEDRKVKRDAHGNFPHLTADYSQAWVRGHEYISQEGMSYWEELRLAHGLTRMDVEQLTFYYGCVTVPEQILFEEYGGMPEIGHLEALAVLYNTTPGLLLDRCYIEKGTQLIKEDSS